MTRQLQLHFKLPRRWGDAGRTGMQALGDTVLDFGCRCLVIGVLFARGRLALAKATLLQGSGSIASQD